ncbi:MAG: 2-dehydro-3-deoxyphosphogluconate aldolase, partial [Microbacteriaceae bacterium]
MSTDLNALMGDQSVMAIFRNMAAGPAVELANRAWDLGISLVEVPIQTPDAVPALEAVVAAGRERGKQVGSGTVTTVDQVRL